MVTVTDIWMRILSRTSLPSLISSAARGTPQRAGAKELCVLVCVQGVKICRVWGASASIGATFVLCVSHWPPTPPSSLSLSVYANKGEGSTGWQTDAAGVHRGSWSHPAKMPEIDPMREREGGKRVLLHFQLSLPVCEPSFLLTHPIFSALEVFILWLPNFLFVEWV